MIKQPSPGDRFQAFTWPSTTGIYQQHCYEREKREARARWTRHVLTVIGNSRSERRQAANAS